MIKVGLVQFAPKLGDVTANISHVREIIDSKKRCNLYVLPELANSGYRFKNRDEAILYSERTTDSPFIKALFSIAEEKQAYIVAGFCERSGDKLYNSSVLLGPVGLIGIYRKLHLFLDEKDIFEAGNLGLPVFDTPIGKIGMQICFDWMFPETWRVLAMKGAELVAHPSNLVLPYCQSVVASYALLNRYFIATTNRVGKERDLTFTGQSVLVSPQGETLLHGADQQVKLLKKEIDLSEAHNKNITARNHAFNDRRTDVYGDLKMKND
nr:nitrilase-related carbon-nitrogen hydrolase [uncultured Carboxylicivirga sp.]